MDETTPIAPKQSVDSGEELGPIFYGPGQSPGQVDKCCRCRWHGLCFIVITYCFIGSIMSPLYTVIIYFIETVQIYKATQSLVCLRLAQLPVLSRICIVSVLCSCMHNSYVQLCLYLPHNVSER